MEFLTRPQPEILKNWKGQNYEEIAAASQPFQPRNALS
jgi:hypothetical protein